MGSISYEILTPQDARKMLDTHERVCGINRPLRMNEVAKYANDMRRGLWKKTSETIKVSADGRIVDGQHRLNALIKSGAMATFCVDRDADPDTFDVIDIGSSRSAADLIFLDGIKHYTKTQLAIIVRLETFFRTGTFATRGRSAYETRSKHKFYTDAITSWPEIFEVSRLLGGSWRRTPISRTNTGALFCIFSRIDRKACADFMGSVISCAMLSEHDPRLQLVHTLNEGRKSKNARGVDSLWETSCVIIAWNAFMQNKSIRGLIRPDKYPNLKVFGWDYSQEFFK